MPKLFKWMKDIPQFEEDLFFEILKSERIRAFILVIIFSVMNFGALTIFFILDQKYNPLTKLLGENLPRVEIVSFLFFAFIYEFGLFKIIGVGVTNNARFS